MYFISKLQIIFLHVH